MADVNCNTEFTLKDIRLLFDDPNASAVVKLITYKGNEYFLSGTLFYCLPGDEFRDNTDIPKIEVDYTLGGITKRQFLYLLENKHFAWSDWDVWELKNIVYWNIKNHLREDDTNYRTLNDIVENKLRSIKATIEIAGWE